MHASFNSAISSSHPRSIIMSSAAPAPTAYEDIVPMDKARRNKFVTDDECSTRFKCNGFIVSLRGDGGNFRLKTRSVTSVASAWFDRASNCGTFVLPTQSRYTIKIMRNPNELGDDVCCGFEIRSIAIGDDAVMTNNGDCVTYIKDASVSSFSTRDVRQQFTFVSPSIYECKHNILSTGAQVMHARRSSIALNLLVRKEFADLSMTTLEGVPKIQRVWRENGIGVPITIRIKLECGQSEDEMRADNLRHYLHDRGFDYYQNIANACLVRAQRLKTLIRVSEIELDAVEKEDSDALQAVARITSHAHSAHMSQSFNNTDESKVVLYDHRDDPVPAALRAAEALGFELD